MIVFPFTLITFASFGIVVERASPTLCIRFSLIIITPFLITSSPSIVIIFAPFSATIPFGLANSLITVILVAIALFAKISVFVESSLFDSKEIESTGNL